MATRLLSMVGSEQNLLVEQRGIGRSACFAQVAFESDAAPATFIRARIKGLAAGRLTADVAA